MTQSYDSAERSSDEAEDEISILDLLILLVRHWKVVIGFPLLVAVLTAGYTLTLPSIYTAETKLLPPQQRQSASAALLSQLGGLGGLLGAASSRGPNDLYIAMLKSRVVADNLIQRFELATTPEEQKHMSLVRKDLASRTNIQLANDDLISIAVEDMDPRRAADLANAYVDELAKLTSTLAVTEASQRRLFYERQFAQAKSNLAEAEATARGALQAGGLVKVDDQALTMVQSGAQLRARITMKEVEISAMRAFATEDNPEMQRARQEIESMRRELAKLERPMSEVVSKADGSGKGSAMDTVRLLREVKYREAIYELLARQFEMAKIDEAKDNSLIQVLDKAIVPDRKSRPKRTLIVLAAALVSAVLAMLYVVVRESLTRAARDPRRAGQVQYLRRMLWRGKG